MGSFDIRHPIHASADDFWQKLFLNPEFNQALYMEKLKFTSFKIVEDRKDDNGIHHRKVVAEPKADAPGPIKKLIGDSIAYTETGTWDPKTGRYRFTVETSKMADKIKTRGEIWVEPKGEGEIERCVHMDIDVKIFGIGKMVEGFIEKSTRDSYGAAARFSNEWIEKHGL